MCIYIKLALCKNPQKRFRPKSVNFFFLTLRSNEDCGRTIHRTNLKSVSKESLRNWLAACIKIFENPSIIERFIVKKLLQFAAYGQFVLV